MEATIDLESIKLAAGGHRSLQEGTCLLEAVSYVAGEKFTDHPVCVSPILGYMGRGLNDRLDQKTRQQLRPFIPRMLNTAEDGRDLARSYMALDWLIRTYVPAFLDLAKVAEASELRTLEPLTDTDSAVTAFEVLGRARKSADAARDAAWDAARAAAWDAARAAAGDAARDAAWDAARDAAWDAAWDAARAAAGDAAWDAARAAARDAAWAAARAAARDALRPTVAKLQASAIDLFDRMILPEAA